MLKTGYLTGSEIKRCIKARFAEALTMLLLVTKIDIRGIKRSLDISNLTTIMYHKWIIEWRRSYPLRYSTIVKCL